MSARRLTPLRGALVLVVALVAQIAIVADLQVVGAVGDLMLVVTVAAALTGGPDRGATYGFFAGLIFDLVVDSPFGLSALTYAVVGYGVGLVCGGLFRPTGLWPLAVAERERPLRGLLADAATALVRRPAASIGLALALLLINALGVAAAVLPLLTVTVAYSFVAAARFALPPQFEEGSL